LPPGIRLSATIYLYGGPIFFMEHNNFTSRMLSKNTWIIFGEGCTSYLLVGKNSGLMIDSGFSTENIQKYAQSLIDVPVNMVANTHGHFDHTGGNGWFQHAYMSAKALEIAKVPYPSLDAAKYRTDYIVTVIGDGDVIDLGGRKLVVIEIPAHAPSSIALLDRSEKILFSGDEVADFVVLIWMQNDPQPYVEQHALNMEKLLRYRDGFDKICSGHGDGFVEADIISRYLEHDHSIMAGKQSEPWIMAPGGPADFHMPQPEFKRISKYLDTNLVFDSRYVKFP